MSKEMLYICLASCIEIIYTQDIITTIDKAVA